MRVFSVGTGLGQLQQEKTHRGDARGIGDAGHSVQCSALSKRCPPDWFWDFMWVVSMLLYLWEDAPVHLQDMGGSQYPEQANFILETFKHIPK